MSSTKSDRARLAVIAIIFATWSLMSAAVLAGGPAVARALDVVLRIQTRPDELAPLDEVIVRFWFVHTFWCASAILAAIYRRLDVVIVLSIGPVLVTALNLASAERADPNWGEIVGVLLIGWVVSIFVGFVYWLRKRRT